MSNLKSSLDWCLASEKRMRRIQGNNALAIEHINKAKHNLIAADYSTKGNFDDWAVCQTYYAMYHSLLAILFKKGFESKNHACTINAIEYLIDTKQINFSKDDLLFIRTAEQMTEKDAKSLREEFQYGTKTQVNKVLLSNLIQRAKEIVEKVEIILNEIP
ncbi:MAG: HEPN domain-containing protein [Nanoarchaeota archaeon]